MLHVLTIWDFKYYPWLSKNHKKFKMDRVHRSGSRNYRKHPLSRLTGCTSPSVTTVSSNKSNVVTKPRSAYVVKTESYKDLEANDFMIKFLDPMVINTRLSSPAAKKKARQDDGAKVLPRRKPTSPSAWALSPGRVSPFPTPTPPTKSPSPGGKSGGEHGGGGIGGVLKYFRQKKVTSSEDTDRRSFALMNNRLLQWRFANAQAESTMSTIRTRGQVTN